MPEREVACHACGRRRTFEDLVPRSATCEGCAANLHSCRCCRFYDESAYNQCAEPAAERVVDKESANFCDYFEASARAGSRTEAPSSGAHGELEELFRKK